MKRIFFLLPLVLLFVGCNKKETTTVPEQALQTAQQLYKDARVGGVDLSSGPCLSNGLFPGASAADQWVVDVAHNPRIELDNYEINQCSAFVKGEAKHFVELDLNGELIKYF